MLGRDKKSVVVVLIVTQAKLPPEILKNWPLEPAEGESLFIVTAPFVISLVPTASYVACVPAFVIEDMSCTWSPAATSPAEVPVDLNAASPKV